MNSSTKSTKLEIYSPCYNYCSSTNLISHLWAQSTWQTSQFSPRNRSPSFLWWIQKRGWKRNIHHFSLLFTLTRLTVWKARGILFPFINHMHSAQSPLHCPTSSLWLRCFGKYDQRIANPKCNWTPDFRASISSPSWSKLIPLNGDSWRQNVQCWCEKLQMIAEHCRYTWDLLNLF